MTKTIIEKRINCSNCGKLFWTKINKSEEKPLHFKCEECREVRTGINDLSEEEKEMLGNCCAITGKKAKANHHILAYSKWKIEHVATHEEVECIENWLLVDDKVHNKFTTLQRTKENFYYTKVFPKLKELNTLILSNKEGKNNTRIYHVRSDIRKLIKF